MREIKFRAWDKEAELMASWEEIDQLDADGLEPFLDMLKNERYEILQYIGLIVNKKPIYEHDIVLIVAEDGDGKEIGREKCVITFDRQSFVFAPSLNHRGLTRDELFSRYKASYLRWELLGNIYENPELLEEGKA